MCRKLFFLTSFVVVLGLINGASAYKTGTILKCDAGADPNTADSPLQAGWTVVVAGINVDVNSTGINVKLETGDPAQIALRTPGGSGPLADVETDLYFANNENKSPGNDFILTLYNLQDGYYFLRSYHNRPDELSCVIQGVVISGAGTLISAPDKYVQNHDSMAEPAEIIFDSSGGGGVAIRYIGPDYADPNQSGGNNSPQAYFNGFTLEYLGPEMPLSSNPNPARGAEQICPGVTLSWIPGAYAFKHNIYFGESRDDVNENADPCKENYVGTSWTPTDLKLGTAYYWRVDEVNVNDGNSPWEGVIWYFTTNDGNAFDLFPGNGWRGVSPSISFSWMPGCLAGSHNIYFGTSPDDVSESADPCVAAYGNTTWTPGSLDTLTTYYWCIEEVNGANTWPGHIQTFKTGSIGGVVMYYKFDGTEGSDLPEPNITDDSGNNIQFTKYLDPNDSNSLVEYGQSNPVINAETGTSAKFVPSGGLYRLDTGENDILQLDGYQYTIEMWIKPNTIPDIGDRDDLGAILIAKENEAESALCWSIELRQDRGIDFFHGGNLVGGNNTRQNMRISSGRNVVRAGEWYHIAAVFDLSDPSASQKLYVNGVLIATAGRPGQNPSDDPNAVGIGLMAQSDGDFSDFYDGLIDELRICDVALGPDDFLVVPGPEWARNPSPHTKERSVDPNVVLMWTPGVSVDTHDIYFGTSMDYVSEGADPCVTAHDTNSFHPGPLEYAATYYWRVDEVNGLDKWEGVIWRFAVKCEITDPNLIVWYKFDETEGDIVQDLSGHELEGYVDGYEPGVWEPNDGYHDGCLVYDDNIAVLIPYEFGTYFNDEITIAVWLNGLHTQSRDSDMPIIDGGSLSEELLEGEWKLTVLAPTGDEKVAWRTGNDSNDVLMWNDATPKAWRDDWHHFAFIKDEGEGSGTMKIYFDGLEVKSKSGTLDSLGYALNGLVRLGAYITNDSDYEGKMDDFRIYNRALLAKEVAALYRGADLSLAWGPRPFDGQPDAMWDVDLTWQPGDYAGDTHNLYFGTNWDEVNEANSAYHPDVNYKNVNDTTFDVGLLELDTTYYWRVDEVNDACRPEPWKGRVWRFTVADYIVIDNMEDYTVISGDYPISTSQVGDFGWNCGYHNYTGAILDLAYIESTWAKVWHGGDQAMYYFYDVGNDRGCGYYYGEISNHYEFDPNDWTVKGVKMLTLWFHGDTENATTGVEQMYAGLEDRDSNYAEVRYGNAEDEEVNDIAIAEWQRWNIPLSEFTDVGLKSIETLYIGFGERGNTVPGGSGNVVFDDIWLYPPTCVPSRRKPEYDLNDDCIVDFGDIELIANDWLRGDINFPEVSEPCDANLVGWWQFDEGDSNMAGDSSDYDNDGVIETIDKDVYWVAGRNDVNYALDFDDGRVLVPDAEELRPMHQVSVCAWINYSEGQDSARVVCKGADNKEAFDLEVDGFKLVFLVRDGNDPNAESYPKHAVESGEDKLENDEWIHVAGTYDGNSLKCYINGEVADANNDVNDIKFLSQDPNGLAIGNRSDAKNRPLKGTIDDVRVYNYALSAQEVAYLASDGTHLVLLKSVANLYNPEPKGERMVDFKDFAKISDTWLEEKLYPE